MTRRRLLDLFCGAGLASDGYDAAGWEVIGVDINPQPDYPYKFIQDDALRLFLSNLSIKGTPCHHERFPQDPITGKPRPWGVYHVKNDSIPKGGRTALDADHAAMLFRSRRLPWDSLKEGFPPAYTAWIGGQMLARFEERAA